MIDLSTKYLGLDLKNPIVVGSSELTSSVDEIRVLAEKGAGAIVLKSLFEEQILMEIDAERVNNMYDTYTDTENYVSYYLKKHSVDEYLKLIRDAKAAVDVPIIASINCSSPHEWVTFAQEIEKAGADALELNIFILPVDIEMTGESIKQVYYDIISEVRRYTKLPLALKIGSYFTGMANVLYRLSRKEIDGMVLFNRFYRPDINLREERIVAANIFSSPDENVLPLRWIGIMSNKVECDLSASTGIHDSSAIIKNLLAGATVTQVVSTLYKNSPAYLEVLIGELKEWMEKRGHNTIDEFRGKLSQSNIKRPILYERSQFMKYYGDPTLGAQ